MSDNEENTKTTEEEEVAASSNKRTQENVIDDDETNGPSKKRARKGEHEVEETLKDVSNSDEKNKEATVVSLPGGDSIADAIRRAREKAASMNNNGDSSGNKTNDGEITRKVYIPVEERPDFNWRGLLIGPRGATQKGLERDSGCRVLLRGEGSQREGKPMHPDDNDKLHVLIIGSSDAQVSNAEAMVRDVLFNPETVNNLKRNQLKELSSINSGSAASASNGTFVVDHSGAPTPAGIISSASPDGEVIELQVQDRLVGLIIGRGGENIRSIQERFVIRACRSPRLARSFRDPFGRVEIISVDISTKVYPR